MTLASRKILLSGLLAVLSCLAACGGEPSTASAPVVRSGEEIYQSSCALCHGILGDGKGSVVLERPARSFLEGAFSFGNTSEAIFRTVSSGIGSTPMPGFADSLSEGERRAVTAYVIGLGPEQVVVDAEASVQRVAAVPQVVRGSFPPVAKGLAITPRGLLLGGLDGLSFQYDASDLRLLVVRQGEFVDRRDWGNRGGDPLQPLGRSIYLCDGGSPGPTWMFEASSGSMTPLRADLTATEVRDGMAWVEYDLRLDGKAVAAVRERGESVSLGGWSGFRRVFEVRMMRGERASLHLQLPQSARSKELFADQAGESLLLEDSSGATSIHHRRLLPRTPDLDRSTLTVELLFGLAASPENLEALREVLP